MRITHLAASNWRNFKNVEFDVGERLFVVGPNAVGKSNLLDVFRFLADIAGQGGGLASAIERRGGLGKVRSLFSRTNAKGRLVVDVRLQDGQDSWRYRLSVKGEGKGRNRPVVDYFDRVQYFHLVPQIATRGSDACRRLCARLSPVSSP